MTVLHVRMSQMEGGAYCPLDHLTWNEPLIFQSLMGLFNGCGHSSLASLFTVLSSLKLILKRKNHRVAEITFCQRGRTSVI